MTKRLNDTGALCARGIRGGDRPDPEAGEACLYRYPPPGVASAAFVPESGPYRPQRSPDAGSESLRGATAYLGERIGTRGTGRE